MLGALYTCSGTTLFNPDSLVCVSGYKCADAPETTTTLTTTTSTPTTTTPGKILIKLN